MSRIVVLLWLVSACASQATAQQAAPSEYDGWINAGVAAFERGELERARSAFVEAHRLNPSARTWRALGTVDYRSGRPAEAFVALDAALRDERQALPPELRLAVQALFERVRTEVALCELVRSPADATVLVDGAEPVRDPRGRLVLALGQHVLTLQAPGHRTLSIDLAASIGGAVERVHVRLEPEPAHAMEAKVPPVAPAPIPGAAQASAPPRAQSSTRDVFGSRTWTWVVLAGAPLFATGAGLSWQRTQDIGDGIAASCDRDRCSPQQREARIAESPLATFETLTNVAWGLAGAALVAGAVVFVIEGESDEPRTQLSVGPRGVAVAGSF